VCSARIAPDAVILISRVADFVQALGILLPSSRCRRRRRQVRRTRDADNRRGRRRRIPEARSRVRYVATLRVRHHSQPIDTIKPLDPAAPAA